MVLVITNVSCNGKRNHQGTTPANAPKEDKNVTINPSDSLNYKIINTGKKNIHNEDSPTPDDVYVEGYQAGEEAGHSDGENGESHGHSFDDSNDYYNYYEECYMKGYEEGYEDGYDNGHNIHRSLYGDEQEEDE